MIVVVGKLADLEECLADLKLELELDKIFGTDNAQIDSRTSD
jgi:hypothetical protein